MVRSSAVVLQGVKAYNVAGAQGSHGSTEELTMKRHLGVSLVVIVLLGAIAPAVSAQGAAEKGATVFAAQKCSMCHALDGKGNAKGALDGVGLKYSAAEIRQWIVAPAEMAAKHAATRKPPMKAFANLPKEDVDALVAFLAAKKKK